MEINSNTYQSKSNQNIINANQIKKDIIKSNHIILTLNNITIKVNQIKIKSNQINTTANHIKFKLLQNKIQSNQIKIK